MCENCHLALPPPPDNYCLRCGGPATRPEQGCRLCPPNGNALDAAYFAFQYQGVVIDLIVGYKFSDRSERAQLLGNLCWERLESMLTWEAPDVVIPLPLHPWRLIRRRYNQAALLARVVARHLHRPLVTNALFRCRMTRPQTRLNAMDRKRNVQDAFQASEERVRGRGVLLV
ncbi:MAG: ComF family protein, partial [Magnetococcales bacterium]|nr:ComF family protein [Magnetococcales bacterium]